MKKSTSAFGTYHPRTTNIHCIENTHLIFCFSLVCSAEVSAVSPMFRRMSIEKPKQHRHCGGMYRSPCHLFAIKSFLRAFGIAYGLRSCLAISLRLLTLVRTRGVRAAFNLSELVGEKNVVFREEAVRWGLAAGFFVGVRSRFVACVVVLCFQLPIHFSFSNTHAQAFNYSHCLLQFYRGVHKFNENSLIAGAISGLSLLFLEKETRRTVALYAFVRLLQSLYNDAKGRGWVKPVWNGDALLFALSSAQIMYAYGKI